MSASAAKLVELSGEINQNPPRVSRKETQRLTRLDILRGFAILLVLGEHVPVIPPWARAGWLGVSLFFVLSGFLIANLLLQEWRTCGTLNFARFLGRRALKIYPPFYFFLLVTAAGLYTRHVEAGRQLLAEFLFLQNYIPGVWGLTWSLAVEEHFYLLLPLLMQVLILRSPKAVNPFRRLPALVLTLLAASLAARLWTAWRVHPFQFMVHYMPSHLRMDCLGVGVLIAYVYNFHPKRLKSLVTRYRRVIFVASIASVTPSLLLGFAHPFVYTVGFGLNGVSFGSLLLLSLYPDEESKGHSGPLRLLARRGMARLGVCSYSIYLWHCPLVMFSLASLFVWPAHTYVVFWVYLASSIGIGIFMHELVEVPVLKWRNKRWPSLALAAPVRAESQAPDERPRGPAVQLSEIPA